MRRAAIITDIHANLPALQAALRRIDELDVDGVSCGGDLVGYGPHPNEVCALIVERAIPTIYGNYDYAIARDLEDCGCAYITPYDRELGQQSVDWTLDNTDERSKRFMRDLPFDLRFEVGAHEVLEGEDDGLRVRIERVDYDVAAVGREVAAVGLPSEFADKLLIAA
jgi:predicted phosphodiesterase